MIARLPVVCIASLKDYTEADNGKKQACEGQGYPELKLKNHRPASDWPPQLLGIIAEVLLSMTEW